MNERRHHDLDEYLERFERRLPGFAAGFVRWTRQPGSTWVRMPLGIVLISGGIFGFLPIVGFWMLPLGLMVLAKDVPPLRPPLARMLDWIERRWPVKN
ncbi:MAG: hypothetical protein WD073_02170 [Xanthobacteraceae bacterium]